MLVTLRESLNSPGFLAQRPTRCLIPASEFIDYKKERLCTTPTTDFLIFAPVGRDASKEVVGSRTASWQCLPFHLLIPGCCCLRFTPLNQSNPGEAVGRGREEGAGIGFCVAAALVAVHSLARRPLARAAAVDTYTQRRVNHQTHQSRKNSHYFATTAAPLGAAQTEQVPKQQLLVPYPGEIGHSNFF